MPTYSITAAKANLSRLVEQAAKRESFIISKSGKPMVKVVALETAAPSRQRRFGFMAGQIKVPADFNRMGTRTIQQQFKGK